MMELQQDEITSSNIVFTRSVGTERSDQHAPQFSALALEYQFLFIGNLRTTTPQNFSYSVVLGESVIKIGS